LHQRRRIFPELSHATFVHVARLDFKGGHHMKRWQDWVNLALGAWMIISPSALGFADSGNVAAWSAWVFGAGIVMFAGMAASMRKAWEEGINIVLGIGLLISPWAFEFASQSTPTSNAAIVGVLVAALALWAMMSDATIRDRLFHRPQAR
jgi:hypothetical protein